MSSASPALAKVDPTPSGSGPPDPATGHVGDTDWGNPRIARNVFLWPALAVVLVLAVFPLVASLGLAFSFFSFAQGGFEIRWAGLANFQSLITGPERTHYLGVLRSPTLIGWLVLGAGVVGIVALWVRSARSGTVPVTGLVMRAAGGVLLIALLWLLVGTLLAEGGRPGTLVITLIYAFVGTGLQYVLGLALAMLTVQRLPGQRFFRIVYIVPLAITPVGVAYMFRMLTDTARGPFTPVWNAFGLQDFALLGDPWGARVAVIIGDCWQWIPFMYIVLLAALEGRDLEVEEAGHVDGASKWRIFRHLTFPALIPVSATVILIRLIEAFKIIDLPNIMTNGGPGTATESVTLQAFIAWRGFNLGLSAATAYTLLIIVTLIASAYVATVIRRTHTVAR
jgi:multiple sugar transport system permease protein